MQRQTRYKHELTTSENGWTSTPMRYSKDHPKKSFATFNMATQQKDDGRND